MHDFIYNVWFFTMDMMEMGEKKPEETYIHENKEKIPRLVSLPSPRL